MASSSRSLASGRNVPMVPEASVSCSGNVRLIDVLINYLVHSAILASILFFLATKLSPFLAASGLCKAFNQCCGHPRLASIVEPEDNSVGSGCFEAREVFKVLLAKEFSIGGLLALARFGCIHHCRFGLHADLPSSDVVVEGRQFFE